MTGRPKLRRTAVGAAERVSSGATKQQLIDADGHQTAVVVKKGKHSSTATTTSALPSQPLQVGRFWLACVAAAAAVAIASFYLWSPQPQTSPSATISSSNLANPTMDDEDTEAFLTWFHASGGRMNDAISITNFDGMGRGIVARKSLQQQDELLFVPMALIICRDTIYDHLSSPQSAALLSKFQKLDNAAGEELLTAFLVLEQLSQNATYKSFWDPYLKILPQYQDTPKAVMTPLFYGSPHEIQELQDPRMVTAALQERQRAKVAFHRFRRLFRAVLPTTTDASVSLEKKYLWARFLINSRAFSIHGERFLVPFGDVFNGQPQPQQQQRAHNNGAHFLQYHRLSNGVGMAILADRSLTVATATGGDEPQATQVFEDYGDNDNYIYFIHHGFLMADNPFDCAAVAVAPTSDQSRLQMLREYGVDAHETLCVTPEGRVAVQDDRIAQVVVSVLSMEEEQDQEMLRLCGKKENAALCVGHATQQQHDQVVLKLIHQQLTKYATTVEQDEELLRSDNEELTVPVRHAIRFRHSRKQILQAATTAIEERLQRQQQKQRHRRQELASHQLASSQEPEENTSSLDSKVARFTHWIQSFDFPTNHVELKYVSPTMGYGTFATTKLAKGQVYLSVPAELILDIHSAMRSPFIRGLVLLQTTKRRATQFTEPQLLVLHLLHEKFGSDGSSESFWKPYLDLLPGHQRLASLLFHEDDSPLLKLLEEAVPSDLFVLVRNYRQRIQAEYQRLHESLDREETGLVSYDRFRWANAILDSRSIWWARARHLVPLLDMVNCHELFSTSDGETSPSAHLPHTTQWHFGDDAAETKASWGFQKGDQVVENYAQPNYIYLLYHGFVLSRNSHDCAHFHFHLQMDAGATGESDRRVVIKLLEEMQLYSWSVDLCVIASGRQSSMDKLLRVALIKQSPHKAAQLERQSPGQVTRDHVQAAMEETTERLTRLQKAIEKADTQQQQVLDQSNHVLLFVKQQYELMQQVHAQLLDA